jgi:hypothetical protein
VLDKTYRLLSRSRVHSYNLSRHLIVVCPLHVTLLNDERAFAIVGIAVRPLAGSRAPTHADARVAALAEDRTPAAITVVLVAAVHLAGLHNCGLGSFRLRGLTETLKDHGGGSRGGQWVVCVGSVSRLSGSKWIVRERRGRGRVVRVHSRWVVRELRDRGGDLLIATLKRSIGLRAGRVRCKLAWLPVRAITLVQRGSAWRVAIQNLARSTQRLVRSRRPSTLGVWQNVQLRLALLAILQRWRTWSSSEHGVGSLSGRRSV